MSEIFHNGKIISLNDSAKVAEAFFVSDENIVFVGQNAEVKSLKTKAVKEVDLNGKYVLPAMFELNFSLLKNMGENEKIANSFSFGKDNDQNKDGKSKTYNFSEIKKLWKEKQSKFIKNGITTVWARIGSQKEFELWQKLSEENLLKIEVIGLINYRTAKTVMDENCRSYRKYKNNFRLGGYTVSLDGKLSERKAWLNKSYKHAHGYSGFGNVVDEELKHIIKIALEEKKQLVIAANGDRAVDQVIACYDLAADGKEIEDNYKLIIETSGLILKQQLIELQARGIGIKVNYSEIKDNFDIIKKSVGTKRAKQMLSIERLINSDLKVLIDCGNKNIFETLKMLLGYGETAFAKIIRKQNLKASKLLECIISNAAYYSFEGEQKGSFDSGKKANFAIIDGSPFEANCSHEILQTFISSKKIYDNKK